VYLCAAIVNGLVVMVFSLSGCNVLVAGGNLLPQVRTKSELQGLRCRFNVEEICDRC
jgi:hypothetical protein